MFLFLDSFGAGVAPTGAMQKSHMVGYKAMVPYGDRWGHWEPLITVGDRWYRQEADIFR
jgi:hypothetical protein